MGIDLRPSVAAPAAADMGELLVAAGVLTPDGHARALRARAHRRVPLGTIVTELGLASEADIACALSKRLGVPRISAAELPPGPLAGLRLSPTFLRNARALPV